MLIDAFYCITANKSPWKRKVDSTDLWGQKILYLPINSGFACLYIKKKSKTENEILNKDSNA